MPFLTEAYEDLPYTLNVIKQLIETEKLLVTEALAQDISPLDRADFIFKHASVEHILTGLDISPVIRGKNDRIAGFNAPDTAVLVASTLLYWLAAFDSEYSTVFIDRNQSPGFIGILLPVNYSKELVHKAYWEKLLNHMSKETGVADSWETLEEYFELDPEDAHRTLNRYKKGEHEISSDNLKRLLIAIFGDKGKDYFEPYFIRLQGVRFICNLMELIEEDLISAGSNREFKSLSRLLLGNYHRYYEYHVTALRGFTQEQSIDLFT